MLFTLLFRVKRPSECFFPERVMTPRVWFLASESESSARVPDLAKLQVSAALLRLAK